MRYKDLDQGQRADVQKLVKQNRPHKHRKYASQGLLLMLLPSVAHCCDVAGLVKGAGKICCLILTCITLVSTILHVACSLTVFGAGACSCHGSISMYMASELHTRLLSWIPINSLTSALGGTFRSRETLSLEAPNSAHLAVPVHRD